MLIERFIFGGVMGAARPKEGSPGSIYLTDARKGGYMDYSSYKTIIACIFAITLYGIYISLYISEKSKSNKLIFYLFWTAYVFGFSYLTFLNRKAGVLRFDLNILRPVTDAFKTGRLSAEPFLNVLLFVPLGMTLPVISRGDSTYKRAALTGAEVSLFIEILQFVSRFGTFELCDIAANTIGTVAGFALYNRLLLRK